MVLDSKTIPHRISHNNVCLLCILINMYGAAILTSCWQIYCVYKTINALVLVAAIIVEICFHCTLNMCFVVSITDARIHLLTVEFIK